jgi:hypothetical protein
VREAPLHPRAQAVVQRRAIARDRVAGRGGQRDRRHLRRRLIPLSARADRRLGRLAWRCPLSNTRRPGSVIHGLAPCPRQGNGIRFSTLVHHDGFGGSSPTRHLRTARTDRTSAAEACRGHDARRRVLEVPAVAVCGLSLGGMVAEFHARPSTSTVTGHLAPWWRQIVRPPADLRRPLAKVLDRWVRSCHERPATGTVGWAQPAGADARRRAVYRR